MGAFLPDDPTRDHQGGEGNRRAPLALVLGCAGEELTPDEQRLFAAADPLGFVLFRRNCRSSSQVAALVAAMREAVGRADAPVLIDQEGGRVARLRPPEWCDYPAPGAIAKLPDAEAEEAARLMARLIADDLAALGISIDCAPVLDVPVRGADPVIGDRAWGAEPAHITRLGRAFCDGLLEGAVLPVIKHIPGHGRAMVDSHVACPRIEADRATLTQSDFAPFRALSAMPWAMTAHAVLAAVDDAVPVTFSRPVIDTIIRGEIGFAGVLISDDISMGALAGSLGARTRRALDAGCDLVLHCNGVLAEMVEVVEAARPVSALAEARFARGEAQRRAARRPFDARAAAIRFAELMAGSAPHRPQASE
jgi:beta-N-acetylhexosaminidase